LERFFEFTGGDNGPWRTVSAASMVGEGLPAVSALSIDPMGGGKPPRAGAWTLRGVISNIRYTAASERARLERVQAGLGRGEARCASLIPIRKTPAWWALAQDERRAIMEEQSHHITVGLDYLPAVARRLYHSRDLGEPFDFLTWFEFAPGHTTQFNELLARLRSTEEWRYIDREYELRLERAA
jgi:chlorite dismutase